MLYLLITSYHFQQEWLIIHFKIFTQVHKDQKSQDSHSENDENEALLFPEDKMQQR